MIGRRELRGALTALTGFLARASNQLVSIIIMLVATRYLDPTEFGVFALASVFVTLIRTLLYTGAFEYLLKSRDARECATECLVANIVLAAAFSGVLASTALALNYFTSASAVGSMMLLLAPSNLISSVGSWREALVLRTGALKLYYGMTTLAELLAMTVALALLFGGFKLDALIWQIYARAIILLLLYSLIGKSVYSDRFSYARMRTIIGWSTSRYGSVLLNFGANYGADFFLGVLFSPAATGLYRASSRLVTAVADLFVQPTRLISVTLFSSRAARGLSSSEVWPRVFLIAGAVGWSALAGLATIAGQIVPIALGPQWSGAAPLVPILCLAHACSLLDAVIMPLLVANNLQKTIFYIQCVTSGLLLLLVALAAPHGMSAATAAVAIGAAAASCSFVAFALIKLERAAISPGDILLILLPMAATVGGALAARAYFPLGIALPVAHVAVSVVGGIVGWLVSVLFLRRRAAAVIAALQRSADEADRHRTKRAV